MNKKNKWIFAVVAIAAVILIGGRFAWNNMGYSGYSMMGGYRSNYNSSSERLPEDQIKNNLEDYLLSYYDRSYYIEEIMSFNNNYYAQIGHQDDDTLAFELIIDPFNGEINDEPGPNMMWNRSYGRMKWRYWNKNKKMSVSESEAIESAQEYLDRYQPGSTAEPHADSFNGYYTIHTVNGKGEVTGMLSVNGFNSRVWYHNWHGPSINVGDEDVNQ